MFIPHHGKTPCTFRLHHFCIYLFLTIIVGGIVGSTLYFLGIQERSSLKSKLNLAERIKLEHERQLKDINLNLNELKSLSQKVKTLTGMGHETSLIEDVGGQGGPALNWAPSVQEFYLSNKSGIMPGVIYKDLKELKKEIYIEKQTYRELIEKLEKKEKLLVCTPTICPVNGAYISSPFGPRRRPYKDFHEGLDLVARRGTPVMSTATGKVIFAGWQGGFGNKVVIDHGNDYKTVYAHMDRIKVRWGEFVKKGQAIGTLGNTGYSTGPHLHYEVRYRGKPVDPLIYILVKLK